MTFKLWHSVFIYIDTASQFWGQPGCTWAAFISFVNTKQNVKTGPESGPLSVGLITFDDVVRGLHFMGRAFTICWVEIFVFVY